jgi:hypothetical protein
VRLWRLSGNSRSGAAGVRAGAGKRPDLLREGRFYGMRNGWRKAFWGWMLLLFGATPLARGAAPRGDAPIHLTADIRWSTPSGVEPTALELAINEGRIVDARSWPAQAIGELLAPNDGIWKIAPDRSGRMRVRLEAPLSAVLSVRAAGKATVFPIATLLEGPQQSVETASVEIRVERLAWDSLEVHWDADGIVAPGAPISLGVGLNIIAPDATEVAVRLSLIVRSLHGDEILAQVDRTEVVAPNCTKPAIRPISTIAPLPEGPYALEVQANWEAVAGPESSRIGRWIRKRRSTLPSSATRRMTFVVLDPKQAPPLPTSKTTSTATGAVVDSIDWARVRGNRPSASGRSPLPAAGLAWQIPDSVLVEASRRDRLRGWIFRANAETMLAPADATGLAWTALGLKVPRPGRLHRLSLSVTGGKPSALGVALVGPGTSGESPRVLLDACAGGPAAGVVDGGAITFSWPVWPDAADPVLLVFNRGNAPVRLGSVELIELKNDLAPAPLAEIHPSAARSLALNLAGPGALDRFGGHSDSGPNDHLSVARNLAAYLLHCGASAALLSDELADRAGRHALDGQAGEDFAGPDQLDLILRILDRHELSAWLDLTLEGPLPGLPPADSHIALAKGLVRIDGRGHADGPAYQPLRREVREAVVRRALDALAPRKSHANLRGILTRLGPGATLPGGPDVGFDDVTYNLFVRETFKPEDAASKPGLGTSDPARFAARRQYVTGAGYSPWLSWRAKVIGEVYSELSSAIRRASPGAVLAVATPALDDGPAGDEARRADLAGLPPTQGWKAVGLDLSVWSADGGPIVLRTVGLSTDDLSHDLAISPELDESLAARPGSGSFVAGLGDLARKPAKSPSLSAMPMADGALGDEPLGHALAALDARWLVLDGSAAAGQEERIRRFARVFRALPAPEEGKPLSPRTASGAAVRSRTLGNRTYLSLSNDTPYTIVVETVLPIAATASVDDLGRGSTLDAKWNGTGKKLAVELLPFGVSAIRIDSPGMPVGAFTTYLVGKRDLDTRAEVMSALLERPGGSIPAGPRNPGFEPAAGVSRIPVAEISNSSKKETFAAGWSIFGDASNTIAIDFDRPHAGSSSLRLDARTLPASAVGETFSPPLGEPLTLKCWLRASPPNLATRIWIEGQMGGRPVVRRADVSARGDWSEFTIRATDLPAGGLDHARLRFEALAAGRLWVDDLSLTGEKYAAHTARARRALTAAVHAYREGRYADFARLAGSSWARRMGASPGPSPEPETALAPPLPPENGGPVRTGDASGLSPNRRLR